MKYHKIRNVPIDVCTAEQMIAYNVTRRYASLFSKRFNALVESGAAEISISEALDGVYAFVVKMIPQDTKYDIDSIACAIRAGLRSYLLRPMILGSHFEIGKAFPALYLTA